MGNQEISQTDIAIIGMSGTFPKSRDLDEWWRHLRDGVELISIFTDEELIAAGVDPVLMQDANYVKASGVLDDITLFDASFFGFNPREAEVTDPQHRFFLETAYHALENAGYMSESYEGRVGVYAGQSMNMYLLANVSRNPALVASVGGYQTMIGNDKDFLATLVSYKLNLRGPSMTIQTACSTSLVAVHMACQSLLNHECDVALAGGVSLKVPRKAGYLYQEGSIVSPDGHCRAFDAASRGTVDGSGVGVVVLKRLSEALADGDNIRAVIKGSAINNDGSMKIGYTAPSESGQAEAIAEALAIARVNPETVTYVEAHGTGTVLGDPVEIAGLTQAFRTGTDKKGFCAIGSVKTNMGHLDAAAGVAGLMKTVLALENKMLPPSLHFNEPNPRIDFANSPFYVNSKLQEWHSNGAPRRAGVSSFGIGGTNSHVVVEESPSPEPSGQGRPWQLLTLSAKTVTALDAATDNLLNWIKEHPEANIADAAYTLQVGRAAHNHRRSIACSSVQDAIQAIESRNPQRIQSEVYDSTARQVVFMFPGQGSQHPDMARELYENEPLFRGEVERCAQLLQPHLGFDIREVLYPSPEKREEAAQRLRQTQLTQPALFVIEYALARLWMQWGSRPDAMIGHSIGEYVAACLAGVFSLEDALKLVATRGRLIQSMPSGAMLAVPLPEAEIKRYLGTQISLATVNAPSLCVLSGPAEAVEDVKKQLTAQGLDCQSLHTSHAFHSTMMTPVLESFRQEFQKIRLNAPTLPYISNVTGTWITATQATDPNYWTRQLRECVRFGDGVAELFKEPGRILLEVGPGHTLSSLAKAQIQQGSNQVTVASLRGTRESQSDLMLMLRALGRLWMCGASVSWPGFYANQGRRRIPLPLYPFERKSYWVEPQENASPRDTQPAALRKKSSVSDWFYVPSWKRTPLPGAFSHNGLWSPSANWLVFLDETALGPTLVGKLSQSSGNVVVVKAGSSFVKHSQSSFTIHPGRQQDYQTLMEELARSGLVPSRIIHLWGTTADGLANPSFAPDDLGFYSILYIMQALESKLAGRQLRMAVVSSGMHEVTGDEVLCPEKVTVLGPCAVVPQEYPNISCYSIDVQLPSSSLEQQELVDCILCELQSDSPERVLAYRRDFRWSQTFEPLALEKPGQQGARLRERGVYLITGGLGGIGLVFAEHLARSVHARLVLTARTSLIPKKEWEQYLGSHAEEDGLSQRIRQVQKLESLGAEVLVVSADIANLQQMQDAVKLARDQWGEIHGVIHAAGVAGGGIIQLKDREAAERVLSPKVAGTQVLRDLFHDSPLDFLVLCSSINAIAAASGQVDYTAANLYLDAFAQSYTRQSRTHTVSINWDTWQEVGMAVNTVMPRHLEHVRQENLKQGITSQEGIEAFDRILATRLSQVVVSTRDMQARLKLQQRVTPQNDESKEEQAQALSFHARPNLSTTYLAPRNDMERLIVGTWEKLLGIEKIGVHDDFFELGGHSLLATQVVSRLRQSFKIDIPVRLLFEASTVAALADRLQASETKPGRLEKIAGVLMMVENMSPAEVSRALQSKGMEVVERS
ncbi:MAG TPA: SDR family NAD(P)-dependent oxidoreductase [Terriglobales bacterium]|jgi:acyl transferase domain-containing protein/acyl carrier protein|nr:SDR family NAD(P)-dependent oxidoreductase [Terriglobales bacterium]